MVRWALIPVVAIDAVFLAKFFAQSDQGPTLLLGGMAVAFLATRAFPGLGSLWAAATFCFIYPITFLACGFLGTVGKGVSVLGPEQAVAIVGALASVAILSWLADVRVPWLWSGSMVLTGLLTAFFSGPQGGAGRFVSFLRDVLHLSEEAAAVVNFVTRKGIHLGVYGFLAVAAAMVAIRQGASKIAAWIAGVSWSLAHAVMDENAQARASNRTGSVWDVLLDMAGMVVGLGLLHLGLRAKAGASA